MSLFFQVPLHSIKAGFKDPKVGSIDDLAEGLRTGSVRPTPREIAQATKQGKFSAGPLGSETITVRGQ